MKEIKAIIQPFMLDKVLDALKEIEDLPGITVSEVRGFGRTRGRGADESDELIVRCLKKAKIEVVVTDALVGPVLEAIQRNAHTGNLGDGKIFVYEVGDVVRIRTGERGEAAI